MTQSQQINESLEAKDDDRESTGDWRLSLVKQYGELVELLGRDLAGLERRAVGAEHAGASHRSSEPVGVAEDKGCPYCGTGVSQQDDAEGWPARIDPAIMARADRAHVELNGRSLAAEDFVAVWIDAAYVANTQFVFCIGATIEGYKRVLGFAASSLEDAVALDGLLRQLVAQGFSTARGVLCVTPGARGLRAVLQACFSGSVQVQRCHMQKSRRVLSYLPEGRRLAVRGALHHAWAARSYEDALRALQAVQRDVARENMSAARQLQEGLEDTLTLHRAGVFFALGRNLKTTCVIARTTARL